MSGICGIVKLDGARVEPQLLRKMADGAAYRGPDGIRHWVQGPAGFAHLAFHTTPESARERQPLLSDDGRYCLVTDARIDNRDDLIPLLYAKGLLKSKLPTDADIIFAAYSQWGEDCAQYLIGDYAFALWNAPNQRLFAARDVMGIRQLYYTVRDGTLYFATTIGSLIAALPSRPALNGPFVEDFLRCRWNRWVHETVYAGIYRLPPAHSLVSTEKEVRLRQYYTLGSRPPPAYQTDEEWILAFRELLNKVLVAQLRSQTPVGILVSGGLDSSAVASVAHDISQRREVPMIKLITCLFDHTPSADEREFFHEVEAYCPDFESHTFLGDELWGFRDVGAESGYPLDEPDIYVLRAQTMALFGAVASSGCRVALSGDWANGTLGDAVYATPRALRAVDLRTLPSEIKHFKRFSKESWVRLLLRAYAPETLLRLYRKVIDPKRGLFGPSPTPWVRPLDDSLNQRQTGARSTRLHRPDGLSISGEAILQWSTRAYDFARLSAVDVSTAFAGIEWRLPYLDRRIVEFALRMPQHMACSNGMNRVILRQSMRGSLPESVRLRMDKPGLVELVYRGFERERNRVECLLNEPRLATLGFIDGATLRDEVHRLWPEGDSNDYRFRHCLPSLLMEAWLRHAFPTVDDITVGCNGYNGVANQLWNEGGTS